MSSVAAQTGQFQEKSDLQRAFYRFKQNPLSLVGVGIILIVIIVAAFASFIAPSPMDGGYIVHLDEASQPPSGKHPFGTDTVGRDVLSRVILGSRVSLMVGVIPVVAAIIIGVPLGLLAGYLGGIVGIVIMRSTDVFLSIPPLVLALAASAALEPSLLTSMFAIAFCWWPWYTKLIYGETLSVKEEDFVEVSESLGCSCWYVMFREILPNITSPIVVKATLDLGFAILLGAALGFLGLGARPPTPEWGTLISGGRIYLPDLWWISTFPGIAISLTVLGFNLLGDGLRDFFDVEVT